MSRVKDALHSSQGKNRKKKEAKTEFQGFFTVNLSVDDTAQLKEMSEQTFDLISILSDFTNVGMKVSLIEQAGGSGTMCSIYAARAGSADSGWGFSAWADSPALALLAAHYKFTYLIGEATFLEYMDENPSGPGGAGFK